MALSSTQIKKALRDRGLNMSRIADQLDLAPTTVWKTVHKSRGGSSRRVQEEIARALEMEREEVFGKGVAKAS